MPENPLVLLGVGLAKMAWVRLARHPIARRFRHAGLVPVPEAQPQAPSIR